MKNKLKMFFSYFKGLNVKTVDTDITFDVDTIEPGWNEHFYFIKSDGQKSLVTPPGTVISIFNELINKITPEFRKYNDYEYSELWYLNALIYPFENRIVFTSDCKQEISIKKKETTNLDGINTRTKEIIYDIFEDDIIKKIELHFYGRWDDGEVFKVYVNDIDARIDSEDEDRYWVIVNDIMKRNVNLYWNGENGFKGRIIVYANGKVIIDGYEFEEEYQPTDMNIQITLDNFNDEL
jgi:hypothetical protein